MTVHRQWRFPRDTTDLAVLRGHAESSSTTSSSTPGHHQLSNEELSRLHDLICKHHTHTTRADQCCSMVVQRIHAPVDLVWPVVRRFDNPQAYKHFIKRCSMRGDGGVGSTRELELVSGLLASSSTERLEILDEERHLLSFKIVGGHCSVTTLLESESDGKPSTIVMESYVVDVPDGNTIEDTRAFADTIVKYNLTSLTRVSEHQARCRHEEKSLLIPQ